MDQTAEILDTLKHCLRARGIGYRQVAAALELSEASVKRLFSEGSFSMRRLEAVCRMLDMTVLDLAQLSRQRGDAAPRVLSVEQERALADDPPLLQCFYLLLNGWTAARIRQEYRLSEPRQVKLLASLDRLRLVELLPGNRVRLRTARNIDWRPGGPVRALYEERLRRLLFSDPAPGSEAFRFAAGELSPASVRLLERRIGRLVREFEELVELDATLPMEERVNTGLMVAFRPWAMRLMDGAAAPDPA